MESPTVKISTRERARARNQRKHHTPEEKVAILRQYVVDRVPGSTDYRNEFLTAASRIATTKKQAIGEVVEWASGDAFKYGDFGRMTEADAPKLRTATELMASALAATSR